MGGMVKLTLYIFLLFLIGLIYGIMTHWSFGADQMYLVINCDDGLNEFHRCSSSAWSAAEPIHVRVSEQQRTVLIYKNGPEAALNSRTLSECNIIDRFNWNCGSEHVEQGRYYSINNIYSDVGNSHVFVTEFRSSLTGWPYFLYRWGLDTLSTAMSVDGFLIPDNSAPIAPSQSGPASASSDNGSRQPSDAPKNDVDSNIGTLSYAPVTPPSAASNSGSSADHAVNDAIEAMDHGVPMANTPASQPPSVAHPSSTQRDIWAETPDAMSPALGRERNDNTASPDK
jgi:hypothetical protein